LLKSRYVINNPKSGTFKDGTFKVIANDISPKMNKSLQSININMRNAKSII